ncbi:MAG TPA: hypothetical protein VLA88_02735 [Candidatus Saccharimonadales bacterium]|nr:hypothetical protein [Candidatus Saccharimonadales bacterium]
MKLRFELRAYEDKNACRLASILQEMAAGPSAAFSRPDLASMWAARYPRHAVQTGKNSIRNRISRAAGMLAAAEIVEITDNKALVIRNPERLALAAANLDIVQDDKGVAIRPLLWARRPAVPAHLRVLQDALEKERLRAQAAEAES